MKINKENMSRADSGFTLGELTVVILVGGLLAGVGLKSAELVKTVKVASAIVQVEVSDRAAGTFQAKYSDTPGDMPLASDRLDGCTAACNPLLASAGNMIVGIDDWTLNAEGALPRQTVGATVPASSGMTAASESYLFWSHLSSAGMLKGVSSAGLMAGEAYAFGETHPQSPIGGGLVVGTLKRGPLPGNPDSSAEGIQGYAAFLVSQPNSDISSSANAEYPLTPFKAAQIDRKVDDGLPGTGLVQAYGVASSCFGAGNNYAEDGMQNHCGIVFAMAGMQNIPPEPPEDLPPQEVESPPGTPTPIDPPETDEPDICRERTTNCWKEADGETFCGINMRRGLGLNIPPLSHKIAIKAALEAIYNNCILNDDETGSYSNTIGAYETECTKTDLPDEDYAGETGRYDFRQVWAKVCKPPDEGFGCAMPEIVNFGDCTFRTKMTPHGETIDLIHLSPDGAIVVPPKGTCNNAAWTYDFSEASCVVTEAPLFCGSGKEKCLQLTANPILHKACRMSKLESGLQTPEGKTVLDAPYHSDSMLSIAYIELQKACTEMGPYPILKEGENMKYRWTCDAQDALFTDSVTMAFTLEDKSCPSVDGEPVVPEPIEDPVISCEIDPTQAHCLEIE